MGFVRRSEERTETRSKVFDGAGELIARPILRGAPELMGKGRVFNQARLEPGSEIGWHIHHGDWECYCILSGEAEYNDNGNVVRLYPGDVSFVGDGEGHAMRAVGDKPLDFIALILYS